MNQAELATRSSVSTSAISKIENGVVSPTYDVLVKLTSGLNISIGQLFGAPRPQPAADPGFNGWQIIEKKGQSEKLETPNYSHWYKEFGPLVRHDGLCPGGQSCLAHVLLRDGRIGSG